MGCGPRQPAKISFDGRLSRPTISSSHKPLCTIDRNRDAGSQESPAHILRTQGKHPMSDLQIETIIKGIATGQYPQKVGSHFGSTWRSDGLFEAEPSPK